MVSKKEITFEEALEKLESYADRLKDENVTLEDAIKYYEEGLVYYEKCNDILTNAKQKIEVLGKDK